MSPIVYRLTPQFSQRIESVLKARGINLEQPRTLATQVKQLSDFYLENPGAHTPWQQPFTANAYLGYFLPLNLIRLQAVMREVRRFLTADSFHEVWDFGSGLGATHWAFEGEDDFSPHPLFAVEDQSEAIAVHRQLMTEQPTRWSVKFTRQVQPLPNALAVFSYSFLEMQGQLPKLEPFNHLLIVEPSTRECGRNLMRWREKLMGSGFFPLAPCTHSLDCPLLIHSQKDWCHSRVHFEAPEWLDRLEDLLPMKNRTLTYSYLLLSRTVQDSKWRGTARVIGDTLVENGKTRQLICRGREREFLSWLHKYGPAPQIPHGALIRGVDNSVRRGGELRPEKGLLTWEA